MAESSERLQKLVEFVTARAMALRLNGAREVEIRQETGIGFYASYAFWNFDKGVITLSKKRRFAGKIVSELSVERLCALLERSGGKVEVRKPMPWSQTPEQREKNRIWSKDRKRLKEQRKGVRHRG